MIEVDLTTKVYIDIIKKIKLIDIITINIKLSKWAYYYSVINSNSIDIVDLTQYMNKGDHTAFLECIY